MPATCRGPRRLPLRGHADAAVTLLHLRSLTVSNLRILEHAELELDADLVVLTGPNGSGKTSFLEAIHLLGTGRSFRARPIQDVLRLTADSLVVSGRFADAEGRSVQMGVEKARGGGARYRVAGQDVRAASELARLLPLVVVTPDSQRLLTDGGDNRRRLLDWLMFHVEPGYQAVHSRYRRALRQRNAMLRTPGVAQAEREAWSEEVGEAGTGLDRLRAAQMEKARPALERALSELSALPVSLEYRRGWAAGVDLAGQLVDAWDADAARGFTTSGPHRADLVIRVHGRPAQQVVSRGEGKVLVFSVMVGFARTLMETLPCHPLVLVDELASELDDDNRGRFSAMLRDLGLQTFVTAVSDSLVSTAGWQRVQRFQLQQGEVAKVLQ